MNYQELIYYLSGLNMVLLQETETKWAFRDERFANPIIWFNPETTNAEYDGSVKVKSINTNLYSSAQIKGGLALADEFLRTNTEER